MYMNVYEYIWINKTNKYECGSYLIFIILLFISIIWIICIKRPFVSWFFGSCFTPYPEHLFSVLLFMFPLFWFLFSAFCFLLSVSCLLTRPSPHLYFFTLRFCIRYPPWTREWSVSPCLNSRWMESAASTAPFTACCMDLGMKMGEGGKLRGIERGRGNGVDWENKSGEEFQF